MKPSVTYLFVSPSGRAYAGWHGCDHTAIPRRGTGPLPDKVRYTGSGKLWDTVARKHGPNLRWIILQRFPGGTPRATLDAAERRAIRLVRRLWGDRCANIRDGGDGWNSDEARALVAAREADPELAAQNRANLSAVAAAWNQSPEGKAHIAALAASWNYSPEGRAAQAKARAAAASPESRAKAEATKRRKLLTAQL